MNYIKDSSTVYFIDVHTSPGKLTLVDAKSFKFVCITEDLSLIGMDEERVYRNDDVLPEITPDNFNRAKLCAAQ